MAGKKQCTMCGSRLKESRVFCISPDEQENPVYVCDQCMIKVKIARPNEMNELKTQYPFPMAELMSRYYLQVPQWDASCLLHRANCLICGKDRQNGETGYMTTEKDYRTNAWICPSCAQNEILHAFLKQNPRLTRSRIEAFLAEHFEITVPQLLQKAPVGGMLYMDESSGKFLLRFHHNVCSPIFSLDDIEPPKLELDDSNLEGSTISRLTQDDLSSVSYTSTTLYRSCSKLAIVLKFKGEHKEYSYPVIETGCKVDVTTKYFEDLHNNVKEAVFALQQACLKRNPVPLCPPSAPLPAIPGCAQQSDQNSLFAEKTVRSLSEEIRSMHQLMVEGILTQEEFDAFKKKLLDS